MARVSIYLNFMGNTEEAFAFYADAFGTEVTALQRFGDVPMPEGAPAMSSEDQAKVLHIEVPILDAQRLYDILSEGSTENAPLQKMFWGAWWGVCLDRYGIRWMFNVADTDA